EAGRTRLHGQGEAPGVSGHRSRSGLVCVDLVPAHDLHMVGLLELRSLLLAPGAARSAEYFLLEHLYFTRLARPVARFSTELRLRHALSPRALLVSRDLLLHQPGGLLPPSHRSAPRHSDRICAQCDEASSRTAEDQVDRRA